MGYELSDEGQEFIKKLIPSGSVIIELGSGSGSMELVKNYELYSIEQNKDWLGVAKGSNYIYAPLQDTTHGAFSWYDPSYIKDKLPSEYDLIIIDGPWSFGRTGFLENIDLFSLIKKVPIIVDDVHISKGMDLLKELSVFLKKPYYKLQNDQSIGYILP